MHFTSDMSASFHATETDLTIAIHMPNEHYLALAWMGEGNDTHTETDMAIWVANGDASY